MTEATSPNSATSAVVDASAVLRAYIGLQTAAERWLAVSVSWPSHVYPEVCQALVRLHRLRRIERERAWAALQAMYALDADVHAVESLTQAAWEIALARSITVYDACYACLAERLDVPLVTADRRLAQATPNAVLLS